MTSPSSARLPAGSVARLPGPAAQLAAAPTVLEPISESSARMLGALGIAGIAVVHILDAGATYHSTRWIFWLYMTVIVAAIPVAITLLHWASPLAWLGAAALAAGPMTGYLLSRSVGLPGDPADVGNWLDTLGMVSLFVEASVITLSVTRLTRSLWPGKQKGE